MAGHDPGVLVHTPRRAETSNEPVLAQAAQLAFFPSPPVGEGAERTKFARRVRGHSPAASCNPSSGHARIPSARLLPSQGEKGSERAPIACIQNSMTSIQF